MIFRIHTHIGAHTHTCIRCSILVLAGCDHNPEFLSASVETENHCQSNKTGCATLSYGRDIVSEAKIIKVRKKREERKKTKKKKLPSHMAWS